MPTEDANQPPADGDPPPADKRSGEGADTALQALIRKRKLAERPDEAQPHPPPPGA